MRQDVPVPEMPEMEALAGHLNRQTAGTTIERCELASWSALKTFDPDLRSLVGRDFGGCRRRGKHLCFEIGGTSMVVHLARGGWVRWYDRLPATVAKPGKGPITLRIGLSRPGTDEDLAPLAGFDITEAGTEKKVAIWLVNDPSEVESVAALALDPLDPGFDLDHLRSTLSATSATLKTVLTSPSLIAGVGNAYSDEILHMARLSPFATANKLDDAQLQALYQATVHGISVAVERARALPATELKGDKHRSMKVHGRTGEACPVCGDTIRQVSYSSRSLQYCATCQTGGKPLADRRLSRLLK